MALNNNPTIQTLIATAAQRVFTYTFSSTAASEITVYRRATGVPANDATQILTQGGGPTQYTVTAVGDNGGSITINVDAVAGDIVTISRGVIPLPTTTYTTVGGFDPSQVNPSFTSGLMVAQQSITALSYRALSYPVSANPVSKDLMLPIAGALQSWRKNAGNTAWELYTPAAAVAFEVKGLLKQGDHPHQIRVDTATPGEVSEATCNDKAITPKSVGAHPGMAKAWIVFNGNTMQVHESYNIVPGSLSRVSVGTFSIVPTVRFTGLYGMSGTCCDATTTEGMQPPQSGTVNPTFPISPVVEFVCRSLGGSVRNFGYIFVQLHGKGV